MHIQKHTSLSAWFQRVKPDWRFDVLAKALALLAAVFVSVWASPSSAQAVLSVPFTNGYIGKDDGSPNNSVETFTFAGVPGLSTGGITGASFSQDLVSGATEFENCNGSSSMVGATLDLCAAGKAQGNDVPGFITLTDSAGTAYKLGGYFNFRGPSGSVSTYVFRVLQTKVVGGISFTPRAISATDDNLNYSMIGLVLIGKSQESSITDPANGDGTFKGNAATSQLLSGLNDYLALVASNRPAGPVTVTALNTTDTTPTLTGSVTLASGQTLSVVVNGVKYAQGDGKLSVTAGVWTLQIPDAQAMAMATYDVDATITNASGYTLNDSTASELVINNAPRFVDQADATVTSYSESYDEEATTSTVLETVTALGADSAILTYSIITNVLDAASLPLFTIDSATGAIRLTAAGVASFANDFETVANTHVLTVRASDGSHTVDAPVTLAETNITEGRLSGHVTKANGRAQAGLTVTLYEGTQVIGTTTTDSNGAYSFAGLPAATYSVRFGNQFSGLGIKGKSPVGRNGEAEVTQVVLTEGTPLTNVDGFVVDPAGVVYSSTTRLPVEGAKVELYVTPASGSRRLVTNAELDTTLGDNNGVLTGADGIYSFLLKDTALTGVYDLVVSHAAYVSPSTDLPASTGPYVPDLGGGAETIQPQATAPTGVQATTHYLSFSFAFTAGDPTQTSNGVVNNHIPLDPVQAAMSVTKSVNQSTVADGATAGAALTYTITAKNTGNVVLGSVSAADTLTGASQHNLTLTRSGTNSADSSFDVDDIWTWTVTYTLLQADIGAGQVENFASVTGTPAGGSALTVYSAAKDVASTATTAPESGSGVITTLTETDADEPAMTVTKTIDETALQNGAGAGDVLTYTITAVNTGNVTLTSVTISDPLTAPAPLVRAGASIADGSFDTGDVWVWEVGYTLTQADIDAGSVENYASVTGTPAEGDPLTVYSAANGVASSAIVAPADGTGVKSVLVAAPAITGVKASVLTDVDTSGGLTAGDRLDYTITVENTGNVTLTAVKLSAEVLKRADGTPVTGFDATDFTAPRDTALAPGETADFTATHTVIQTDIDAGGLSNLATVAGMTPDETEVTDVTDSSNTADTGVGKSDPTTNLITAAPQLSISKTVDDHKLADGIRAGDTLVYTITVENTGNVTLTDIGLVDDFTTTNGTLLELTEGPDLTGLQADRQLDVGESWVYTASFTLDADAIALISEGGGGVKNIATANAKAPNGNPVEAQSSAVGNTGKVGEPTGTGFPGEISGTVREYLAGASGVKVYLMVETAPNSGQYENAEDENGEPITTTTDSEGHYAFPNLKSGRYGVSFGTTGGNAVPTASSDDSEANGNEIVDIIVGAGAVKVGQDAFFVDPSGVVYDAETLAPIAGAKVTLYFNNAPVPDSWLNVDLGHRNGSLTGPDGAYAYLFDPATAASGVYTIVVERTGFTPSVVYPANPQVIAPDLGGGLEKIVPDDVPGPATLRTYYMSLRVQFTPGDPALTSNGIVNNHIPMDLKLLPLVEDEVVSILKEDLAMTMAQQGRIMEGFSKGALDRLKSREGSRCVGLVEKALRKEMIRFDAGTATITPKSLDLLEEIAVALLQCPYARFEVGAHLAEDAEGAVDPSQRRAEAVVAALELSGIVTKRLVAQGYGTTQPLADAATAKGRAKNERIVFTELKDTPQDDCRDGSTSDRSFNAAANDNGGSMNGGFKREKRRCADDSWRILEGSASYGRSGTGIDQMMFDVSIRRQRFTSDRHLSGRFLGAYGSSSTVTGRGEGTILGFGLNAGIYGASRIGRDFYFDYYLGAAGGRHAYDLEFDRAGGGVTATGSYRYGAVFAGAALSGQTEALGLTLTPRAGVNLAWSPGGAGTILAVRGPVSDASDLTIPAVMGARVFAEVTFENLLSENGTELTFTPRILCDQAIGEDTGGCGYGASVELARSSEKTGRTYALGVGVEKVGDSTTAALALRYKWSLGTGALGGGLDVSTSGEASIQSQFKVEF